jgi:hypothetical protein
MDLLTLIHSNHLITPTKIMNSNVIILNQHAKLYSEIVWGGWGGGLKPRDLEAGPASIIRQKRETYSAASIRAS